METLRLLRDLTELSPAIDNRISELSSSILQDDYDHTDSTRKLLSEALCLLVDLLAEQGITFHVDDEQLMADRYSIGFIIGLYTNYIPHKVIDYISRTPLLCSSVCAAVTDIAPNEYIVKLLEAVKDGCRSEYNDDMYTFLHDKISSTEEYSKQVHAALSDLDAAVYDSVPVEMSSIDVDFLMQLSKERDWFKSIISNLLYRSVLPLDYHLCMIIASQVCLAYSLPENAVLLSRYNEFIQSNNEIIVQLLDKIHKESSFYAEHYTDEQLEALPPEMITTLILVQYIDHRLFGIQPDLKRVEAHATNFPFRDVVRSIPIQNTVN